MERGLDIWFGEISEELKTWLRSMLMFVWMYKSILEIKKPFYPLGSETFRIRNAILGVTTGSHWHNYEKTSISSDPARSQLRLRVDASAGYPSN